MGNDDARSLDSQDTGGFAHPRGGQRAGGRKPLGCRAHFGCYRTDNVWLAGALPARRLGRFEGQTVIRPSCRGACRGRCAGARNPHARGAALALDLPSWRNFLRCDEIAPDIADQTFHLALVVSFPRPPETVVEQVMTLQLRPRGASATRCSSKFCYRTIRFSCELRPKVGDGMKG